jgi:hypothetical protein
MGLIERISTGINRLADKTNQALDEGRLRLDLLRVRRRRDNLARDLGYLTFRQTKGTAPAEGEADALIRRMEDCDAEILKLDLQISEVRRAQGPGTAGPAPEQGPTTTDPAPGRPAD